MSESPSGVSDGRVALLVALLVLQRLLSSRAGKMVLMAVAIHVAWLAIFAFDSGLTWRDLDLDSSGFVSLSELRSADDLGTRAAYVDGRPCTEVYWLKDRRPVKVVCETR